MTLPRHGTFIPEVVGQHTSLYLGSLCDVFALVCSVIPLRNPIQIQTHIVELNVTPIRLCHQQIMQYHTSSHDTHHLSRPLSHWGLQHPKPAGQYPKSIPNNPSSAADLVIYGPLIDGHASSEGFMSKVFSGKASPRMK